MNDDDILMNYDDIVVGSMMELSVTVLQGLWVVPNPQPITPVTLSLIISSSNRLQSKSGFICLSLVNMELN